MELAWLDCPYGKIDDPYPGSCFRYIDTNNNLVCDHSESTPPEREIIGSEVSVNKPYNTFMWALYIPIAVYFIYWYLVEKTDLRKASTFFSPQTFRLFWNIVLLLTFLAVGITGFLQLYIPSRNASVVHVNTGLVMVVVATLHIVVRLNYFQAFIKRFKGKRKDS